jgi:hypothetical protein
MISLQDANLEPANAPRQDRPCLTPGNQRIPGFLFVIIVTALSGAAAGYKHWGYAVFLS